MPDPVLAAVSAQDGIGWFSLALINAGLAQGKRRSGLNWWLISLFLGPLATFFLVAFCDPLPETA